VNYLLVHGALDKDVLPRVYTEFATTLEETRVDVEFKLNTRE
jgi:hypothetical protein